MKYLNCDQIVKMMFL